MTATSGLPDWQDALIVASQRVLKSYGQNSAFYLMPEGLSLAADNDGTPSFMLDFYADRNISDPKDSQYTMFDLALQRDNDASGALQDLRAENPGATLQPVKFGPTAYWILQVPGANVFSREFAWENAETLEIYQRIPQDIGLIIYHGLQSDVFTALSLVQCELNSVMPRVPVSVTFSPKALLEELHGLQAGDDAVSVDRMIRYFSQTPAPSPLRITGALSSTDVPAFAQAMVGQVRKAYGHLSPAPTVSDGPYLMLTAADEPELPNSVTYDLRSPLFIPYPVAIFMDPFETAVQIVKQQGIDTVSRFTRVPSFDGMDTISLLTVSGLPKNLNLVGALEVVVTLRIAPDLTPHGNAFSHTVSLYPQEQSNDVVQLKFRDPSSKKYTMETRVVTMQNVITSPVIECTEDYLYIGLAELPAETLSVAANPDLLGQVASINLTLLTETGGEISDAQIRSSAPSATFLLNGRDMPATLHVTAESKDATKGSIVLDLPSISTTLNPFAFPGYGPQVIHVNVNFSGKKTKIIYEFEAESDPGTPILVSFTDSTKQQDVHYFASNIFDSRYRYRRDPADGTAPGSPWSEYLDSDLPLNLSV